MYIIFKAFVYFLVYEKRIQRCLWWIPFLWINARFKGNLTISSVMYLKTFFISFYKSISVLAEYFYVNSQDTPKNSKVFFIAKKKVLNASFKYFWYKKIKQTQILYGEFNLIVFKVKNALSHSTIFNLKLVCIVFIKPNLSLNYKLQGGNVEGFFWVSW